MKILVASTVPPWKSDEGSLAWLGNAEAMVEHYGEGFEIEFFCAIEVDGRGLDPHVMLLTRMDQLRKRGIKVTTWKFMLDDGADEYKSGNRLFRICTGRNSAHEYAMVNGYDAILFLDTDVLPDADSIPKLAEIDHPVVGGFVGAYCMTGPRVTVDKEFEYWVSYEGTGRVHTHGKRPIPEGVDVEAHWNTAGFLMLRRQVFTRIAWNYDLDSGLTDDPAFQRNTAERFGTTWVRKDVNGLHVEPLVPVEQRAEDRTYVRA